MDNSALNRQESSQSVSSIFESVYKIRGILPLGIKEDISRYNDREKASYLDDFVILYESLSFCHGNQKLTEIHEDISHLKQIYGLQDYDVLEQRYTGLSPVETIESSGVLMCPSDKVANDTARILSPANDNKPKQLSIEEKQEQGFPYIKKLLQRLIQLVDSRANNEDELIKDILSSNANQEGNEDLYSIKYELTQILEIPELSTWKAIIKKIEEQYPDAQ